MKALSTVFAVAVLLSIILLIRSAFAQSGFFCDGPQEPCAVSNCEPVEPNGFCPNQGANRYVAQIVNEVGYVYSCAPAFGSCAYNPDPVQVCQYEYYQTYFDGECLNPCLFDGYDSWYVCAQ